ncbi:hypothetical protein GCM10027080_35400 [Pedococcus soli]
MPGHRAFRVVLLQLSVFAAAWLVLGDVDASSRVPAVWPAVGLIAGFHLTSSRVWRPRLLAAGFAVMVVAYLLRGYPLAIATGFSASSVVAAHVVRQRLIRSSGRAALLDKGDVSTMIGSTAMGAAVAGLGYGAVCAVTGTGNPLLGALAAFGSHTASLMVLLPLFLRTPRFQPLAGQRERLVQSVILLATTVVVFVVADAPPIIFVVMPMFAWLAFRGTLREATLLLTAVGVIGSGLTAAHLGPIWDIRARYDLSPELAAGVLQLFLIDSGLILLPLAVMATQQRMSAASAARERETRERLVAQATGTAVVTTDRDGRVVLFNPGAETMLGRRPEAVVGSLLDAYLSPDELRRHASDLSAEPTFAGICRASVGLGDTHRLWSFRRSDGEERSVRMTLSAIPDEDGGVSGFLATAEDVTEREAAHEALMMSLQHEREAAERLRETDRVKADFLATVSHELRTPITNIIGYTEVLDDGVAGELTTRQHDIIGRVERNSRRLLLLVEDLLTLSQIESSELQLKLVPTDLRRTVSGALESLAPVLASRSLEISTVVPEGPLVSHVDPVQLERALLNLLTNAVKFTPDGGSIEVRLAHTTSGSEIVVHDTGMGIPEAEHGQLFRRFFRSSTVTEQAIQGTGLGLSIVHAIVAQHQGHIEVASAQGRGSTFTVRLPHVVGEQA